MLTHIAIVCVICALLYVYGTGTYGYWSKRGVKHDAPIPFCGNARRTFMREISMCDLFTEVYWKNPGQRFVGFYLGRNPSLILRDPELIKSVIAADASSFYSRGFMPYKELHEPLLKNLVFADGDLWKLLRQTMTPAFTTGKLKAMFPLIVEKAEKLHEIVDEAATGNAEVDMRDIMARYTTDSIGAIAFGINSESMNNENSQFRKLGNRILTITKWDATRHFFKFIFPETFQKMYLFCPFIEDNIMQLMRGILKQRNYIPSARNDFVDQLMELKQKGKIQVESVEHKNPDGTPKLVEMEMDEYIMAGQIFVFFTAGFETSSSASSYTLHQLAFHPEAQRKCQQEIDDVLSRYDNKLCYEAVSEMKYLEMCLKESLRLFPSVGWLKRRCERPYLIPGTSITIDPKVNIIVPVSGLHRDPLYWDEPDRFIPERFENGPRHKFVYLPFGEGPRACIGERLGRMQSLAGLAALLRRFSVAPAPRSRREPPRDPTGVILQRILGGIPLRVRRRN
ncbi:probable cytochrome P450 6a13 [Choristoneura fumiferana]|uniref:probable cytochrome P450 6a13 n=1 Tax=Choristoneura fumiferana TaxID=7141 RepID=UPI003D1569A0